MSSIPQPLETTQEVSVIGLPSGDLKSYPELNRFCIAERLTGPYRIWLLCRLLDPAGRGTVSRHVLLAALEAHGLNRHHLRRVRTMRNCRSFLTFHQTHVEYRSLEAVCLSLGVTPGRAVSIPIESISSIESFHASLYAAWIASHDELYISRERLSELFNVSHHSQRRWEGVSGTQTTFNVVTVSKSDQEAAEAHIPRDARLDERLDRSYVWEYEGSLYYQSVNRYSAPQYTRYAVGNVRKVSRAVRAAVPVEDHGDGTRRRVFYTERTTPANYQEKRGCCLRTQRRFVDVPHGPAHLWRFSTTRPVAKQEVLC